MDDSPILTWNGSVPVSTRFDDPYYSVHDPLGEVRHTFLDGVGFDALCRLPRPVVAETGFGTGLNFLEAWRAFERAAPSDARLTFLSVEAYPMGTADLARAHDAFPEHAERAAALRSAWPSAVPGDHRLSLAGGRIRLILAIGEVEAALARHDFHADAWFLDGFAPARNPEMWRDAVLAQVARLSRAGARLASFTAAGAVRRGLAAAGFEVEKRPGFGRKRDCLTACRADGETGDRGAPPWAVPPPPLPDGARVAVIGDGIAGRAMTDALRADGREVLQIGGAASTAYAASTLPQALIAPKLVRGDQPYPVFWRQAFTDALRVLDDAGVWRGPRGLILPARDAETRARQKALLEALGWPETTIRPIGPAEASDRLGRAVDGGLFVPGAGSIDPGALRNSLAPPPEIASDVARLEERSGGWSLIDAEGRQIAEADAVVVAAGPGSAPLLGDAIELRIAAGRLASLPSPGGSGTALMADGYATAAEPGGMLSAGATAEPWAPLAPVAEDAEKDAALFDRIARLLPDADPVSAEIWRGLRCDTVDHLPIAGPVPDSAFFARAYAGLRDGKPASAMPQAVYRPGLYALTGLGSRGFQGAFLCADLIAAQLRGMPAPMDSALELALAPGRFAIRKYRKG